jgi:hypothetical protein
MAYKSGEFTAPGTETSSAATVFNNTLFVLDPFGADGPVVTTFDLTKLKKHSSPSDDDEPINSEALTNPANWIASTLALPRCGTKVGFGFADGRDVFLLSSNRKAD